MTNRDRERETLNFGFPVARGTIEETFYPWDLTVERFSQEGLPKKIQEGFQVMHESWERYFRVSFGTPVMMYEHHLGFDPVRRISMLLPYGGGSGIRVASSEEWQEVKKRAQEEISEFFSDEIIENAYGRFRAGQDAGEYSVRMNIEGFFWIPRELLGVEEHLYAFYDAPELLHDINQFTLEIYIDCFRKILKVIRPDVLYIQEDLSGKNGPMISKDFFREFVGEYYQKLIPILKEGGCENVFVDTDGDFMKLIPDFLSVGVDGFLPMDVNAGMDIVAVRRQFPNLKFIGGFNKLKIAEGRAAIDKEFKRILPVIRQGGYIPGADHQVTPSTSLDHYKYYIMKLREMMRESCTNVV